MRSSSLRPSIRRYKLCRILQLSLDAKPVGQLLRLSRKCARSGGGCPSVPGGVRKIINIVVRQLNKLPFQLHVSHDGRNGLPAALRVVALRPKVGHRLRNWRRSECSDPVRDSTPGKGGRPLPGELQLDGCGLDRVGLPDVQRAVFAHEGNDAERDRLPDVAPLRQELGGAQPRLGSDVQDAVREVGKSDQSRHVDLRVHPPDGHEHCQDTVLERHLV